MNIKNMYCKIYLLLRAFPFVNTCTKMRCSSTLLRVGPTYTKLSSCLHLTRIAPWIISSPNIYIGHILWGTMNALCPQIHTVAHICTKLCIIVSIKRGHNTRTQQLYTEYVSNTFWVIKYIQLYNERQTLHGAFA